MLNVMKGIKAMSNKIKAINYVVLDVETNGLSSINDDLLSISKVRLPSI